MQLLILASTITAGLVLAGPAFAMGETLSREVDQVFPLPCPGGTVHETYFDSGNIHGFGHDYSLVCSIDQDHAKWVIRSALTCYDPADNPVKGGNLCDNRLVNAVPNFDNSGEFWDQKTAPFVMRFRLIKMATGKNCTKITQSVSFSRSNLDQSFWSCRTLEVKDGSTAPTGDDLKPRDFRVTEVVTVSSKPMVLNDASVSTYDFVVSPSLYTCTIGYFSGSDLHC